MLLRSTTVFFAVQDFVHLGAHRCSRLSSTSSRVNCGRVAFLPVGIADHAGEVADDEDDPVAEVLELTHLLEQHAVPKVKVGRRRIEAGLDGERRAPLDRAFELGGELRLVDQIDGENRFVGMKSRGVYETPGGTILWHAHRAIESLTLDRGAMHLKDELMPRYAELVYNGFWFSPEREMLQALIDESQEPVDGEVRLKLYKGNVIVIGRESPKSLYSSTLVTFEDDRGTYDQKDAEGFIKLNALRLRTLAMRDRGR